MTPPRSLTSPSHTGRRSSRPVPLKRVNKEIKPRSNVAGVFPNPAALMRPTSAVLIGTHAEQHVSNRYHLSQGHMAQLTNEPSDQIRELAVAELIEAWSDEHHRKTDDRRHLSRHAVARNLH